ncbi:uncharacterized protein AB675_11126 [Cyphellophora attinorum]|uniref:Zn(2)-C6 fungal-type domain-containing protein n=1 Tax=Cyphellophora attinorum TaxID=1664694 RepID=A0A0N0NII7_9EURO|nr:uncharacterized protein AB675_11126 [Phialophora attinorum]KPI35788.1 hypothetical protein AB675_11126 [Phialophora attinorum]
MYPFGSPYNALLQPAYDQSTHVPGCQCDPCKYRFYQYTQQQEQLQNAKASQEARNAQLKLLDDMVKQAKVEREAKEQREQEKLLKEAKERLEHIELGKKQQEEDEKRGKKIKEEEARRKDRRERHARSDSHHYYGPVTMSIRKVKCGLERPSCERCISTGRKCDGYQQMPSHQPQPQRALDTPSDLGRTQCEKLCLDFYYSVSAPTYVNFGSHYFWNSLVIQACYHQDAIRHLVIASTSLDLATQKRMAEEKAREAFAIHYGIALRLLSSAKEPEPEIMLMACLLFILCDEYNNDPSGVRTHLTAGKRILRGLASKNSAHMKDSLSELAPIFTRFEDQSDQFEISPRSEAVLNETDSTFWSRYSKPVFKPGPARGSVFMGYSSMAIATHCLQKLAPSCFAPANERAYQHVPRSRFHVVPSVTSQLDQWLTYFRKFVSNMSSAEYDRKINEINTLFATQICLDIMSRCAPYLREDIYDLHEARFKIAFDKLSFVLNETTPEALKERAVCPLYFIAAHCRTPLIRRRATEWLKLCGWTGIRMATIAQQIINMEERIDWTSSATDVPAERRVQVLDVSFSAAKADVQPLTLIEKGAGRDSVCVMSYAKKPWDGSNNDVHIFRWADLPASDEALHASVRQLLGRVARFELIAAGSHDSGTSSAAT